MPSTVANFADVLVYPSRSLAGAVDRRSFVPPLLAATLAALLLAAAVAPRVDVTPEVNAALDCDPEAAQLTPHDREARFDQARKLALVSLFARGLFGPAGQAVGIAVASALALRLAAARAPFSRTFAAAAWAGLPGAVRDLLSIPAVLRQEALPPGAASGLLQSSAAAVFTQGPPPLLRLAAGLDLFSAWAAVLLGLGLAAAAGTTHRRGLTVAFLLWAAWIALVYVALPGFTAPPGTP